MASFITKKVSVETLGEYLRDARFNMRLTQEQVSSLTQIPPRALELLESGEYAELPADVYVKGFLKSLAVVYEVETEILLEQYYKEKKIDLSIKKVIDEPIERSRPRVVITPKTLTISMAGIVAISVVGYLLWQVTSVTAAPRLEIYSPEESHSTQNKSVLLRGSTEPGARVYVNAQEVPVEDSGEFSEVLNLSDGVNNILIRAENKFDNVMEASRVVLVAPSPHVAQAESGVSIDSTEPISITLAIGPEDAWIEVISDSAVVFSAVLPAETKQVFTAKTELLLSTGNAGSTSATYNGQDLGILGRTGEVLTNIRFTP